MKRASLAFVFGLASHALAQEVSFGDYLQPPKPSDLGHSSMDGNAFYNVGVTAYSVGVNFASTGYAGKGFRLYNWQANGDADHNGSSGLGIPLYGKFGRDIPALDVDFMYNPETGAPRKYRIDLYDGTNWTLGSSANGGLVTLNGTVGAWNRFRIRRVNTASDGYGNAIKPVAFRMMAIQNTDNNYPGFGGTYNTTAGISFDNFRVSLARRLNGVLNVSGTTSKTITATSFTNLGTAFSNNWIQSLGSSEVVNVYGFSNFGDLNTATQSSNIIYTYLSSPTVRQFNAETLNANLTGISTNKWMGAGVAGDPATDKFFACYQLSYPPNYSCMIRQLGSSTYTHYFRALNDSSGYASEVTLDLGGEPIVAIADVNGDAMDDVITRSGGNYKVRVWTGTSGSWPATRPTFAAPVVYSANGYLKCLAVADLNDDGLDDLVVTDAASGDVFTLVTSTSGTGTLKWLFRLDSSTNQKVLAVTDADGDGFPDIYTSRRTTGSAGEIDILKLNSTGTGVLSFNVTAPFNYTNFQPIAIGDINGDGSADIVMVGNDSPVYTLISYLVNPLTFGALTPSKYVSNANAAMTRPIFGYGSNE